MTSSYDQQRQEEATRLFENPSLATGGDTEAVAQLDRSVTHHRSHAQRKQLMREQQRAAVAFSSPSSVGRHPFGQAAGTGRNTVEDKAQQAHADAHAQQQIPPMKYFTRTLSNHRYFFCFLNTNPYMACGVNLCIRSEMRLAFVLVTLGHARSDGRSSSFHSGHRLAFVHWPRRTASEVVASTRRECTRREHKKCSMQRLLWKRIAAQI